MPALAMVGTPADDRRPDGGMARDRRLRRLQRDVPLPARRARRLRRQGRARAAAPRPVPHASTRARPCARTSACRARPTASSRPDRGRLDRDRPTPLFPAATLSNQGTEPPYAPHDPALRSRPLPHPRRQRRRPGAAQLARPRPARRGARLQRATGWPSTTTCRASPAPPPRSPSPMSPRAPRRIRIGAGGIMLPNHAPLVDRRAVRHPGRAPSRPHRPRPRPRARHRPAHRPRAAPQPRRGDVDAFPQDVMELMAYFRPAEPGQRVQAVPGAGLDGARLDPRLQHLRRPARGGARPALRLRLPLRARVDGGGDRHLPRALPPLRATRPSPT